MQAQLPGIIRLEAGGSRGTGFIVRIGPGQVGNDVVEILTALHVVADLEASQAQAGPSWRDKSVTARFYDGRECAIALDANSVLYELTDDWALLRAEVKAAPEWRALRLARLEDRTYPRRWSTYGYSDAQSDTGELHSGDIELVETALIHLYGKQASAGAGGLVSGISGAPLVFEGHVVGIILQSLQDKKRQTIHGAMYGLPIDEVAKRCGLPLAPGPQVFQAEVEAALSEVRGTALQELADALCVPRMESEGALRIWIARALLLAEPREIKSALVTQRIREPAQVVEMALTRMLREDCVAAVKRCLEGGHPRGVVTVAGEPLTIQLLVARALQNYELARRHLAFVDSRACTPAEWSSRIRDAIVGLLQFAPEDAEDDALLEEGLGDLRFALLLAFPLDGQGAPFEEIERYTRVGALPMISPQAAANFVCRARYELASALDDAEAEKSLKRKHALATSYLKPPPGK